jgi:prevent-host-death family protein
VEGAEGYESEIDLLITDVVLPGMNGRDLARQLAARRPSMASRSSATSTRARAVMHVPPASVCDRRRPPQFDTAIFCGYNRLMKVSVAEAKNTLPKLIKAVEDGESVTICRHGTPVVDIVRTTKAHTEKPKFGTLKGRVKVFDPDWWKPMSGDDVDVLLDGC